jgi:predicted metallopeptidase
MSHDHPKQEKWKYATDANLTGLFREMLAEYDGFELAEAATSIWKILFTNNSLGDEEIAGRCQKVSGAIRHLWGIDYIILIQKTHWDAASPVEKVRTLVHEATHIKTSKDGEPEIRKHGGDFCTIAAHDKQSYRIAELVYRKLKTLKEFQTQQEIVVAVPA